MTQRTCLDPTSDGPRSAAGGMTWRRPTATLGLIVALGGVQVATGAVGLLRTKLVAVLLGPAGFGITAVVDQVVQLALQATALSLPFAAVRFLARAHSRAPADFHRTYAVLFRLIVAVTGTGAGVLAGLAVTWPASLGPQLRPYVPYLVPALLSIPAMALHGFFVQVFAAAQRPRTAALFLLSVTTGLAVAVGVGTLLAGVEGLYWATLLVNGIAVVAALRHVHRRFGVAPRRVPGGLRRELSAHPDLVTFTLVTYAIAWITAGAGFVVRYAALTARGEAETGFVQAAMLLGGVVTALANPGSAFLLTPAVNRQTLAREKHALTLAFGRRLVAVVGIAALPLVLFAPWWIELLFSPAFAAVGDTAFLFVAAQACAQLAGVHQALLIGLGDMRGYGLLVGLGQVALAGGTWILAPLQGARGIGLALLASAGLTFALTLVRLARVHAFRLEPVLLATTLYELAALLGAGAWAAGHSPVDLPAVAGRLGLCAALALPVIWGLRAAGSREGG